MHSDPIADMLTRIRNAQAAGRLDVNIPFSKEKLAIAKVLKESGFTGDFKEVSEDKPVLNISLNYINSKPKIKGISRISKPGGRVYVKNKNLHRFLHGFGIYIVSTPKGIMSDNEARKKKVGGEVICNVW